MPSRFADGKLTYKYDLMSNSELIAEMDRLLNLTTEMEVVLNRLEKKFTETSDLYQEEILQLSNSLHELSDNMDEYNDSQVNFETAFSRNISTLVVFRTVIKSRWFRFLNFFGRWCIYGYDGYVYPNTDKYAEFGKVPLLTRLGNKLRHIFS